MSMPRTVSLALALVSFLPACFDGGIDEASLRIATLQASSAACGADDRGTLRCWGGLSAPLGQPGLAAPVVVPTGGQPQLVTLQDRRGDHGCALDAGGQAWCWGANHEGQVGVGRRSNQEPLTPVATDLRFTAVGAAYATSCGLATDQVVYCWGDIVRAGQPIGHDSCPTGYGTTYPCLLTPRPVNSPERFTSLSSGNDYSCALAGSTPHCWSWYDAPLPVDGLPAMMSVQAGSSWACGQSRDNEVICWSAWQPAPAVVPFPNGVVPTSLTVGGYHACVRDAMGAAWCWGYGLGVGNASGNGSPVPVEVIGGLRFTRLAAGDGFTCGIREDGAWCWGSLVGDGSGIPSAVPVRAAGQGNPG